MKRKYELNLYAPFQYEDLQDHFERMAARGWALESLGGYLFTYRKTAEAVPLRYALAFHPQVSWLEPLPTAGQENYASYCWLAGWELVGTWSKFPQIQVYVTRRADSVPLQTDLSTQWRVLTRWMEDKYIKPLQTETAFCGIFALFGLLIFGAYLALVPALPLLNVLLVGMIGMMLALLLRQFIVLVEAQRWFQEALRAEREGRAGPAGRISRAWLLSLGVSVGAVALGFLLLLCAVGAFYGAWTAAKAVFVLLLFAGLGPLGVCIRDLLRRKGPSRAANQVMFLVAAVAAALLYWWVKHQLLPF